MIELISVTKKVGKGLHRRDLFTNISGIFERGFDYIVLGNSRQGKTTLLRLLCGLTIPNCGKIRRYGNVSMPPGSGHNLAGLDTAREYIHLIATVYQVDFVSLFKFVVEFSEIGAAIKTPVLELPPETRYRFMTSLSYAVPAVFYLFDGHTFMGSKDFQERCQSLYYERRRTANVIHSTSSFNRPETWDGFKAAIVDSGGLYFFDTFAEAVSVLQEETASTTYGTLEYAQLLIRKNNADEAAHYLEAFVSAFPDDKAAIVLLTQLHFRTNQFEKAEATALLHVQRFGKSDQICLTLASIMERRQLYAKAVSWAERHLEDEPTSREAMLVRARSLGKIGLHSAAGDAWQAMIPQAYAPALKLAIRAYIIDERWQEALDLIEQAAPADNSDGLLEHKCTALMGVGRWREMVETVKLLLASDQRSAIRAIYRAIVRVEPVYAPLLTSTLAGVSIDDTASLDTIVRIRAQLQRNVKITASKGSEADSYAWSEALAYLDDRA